MVPAIQFDETARVTDKAIIKAALARCIYRLPGALATVWQGKGWHVVEQAYDLQDVYASYMEVHIEADDAIIHIRCPMNDLYWIYILFGGLRIAWPETGKTVLSELARHYRLGYLPKGEYNAVFKEGNHQLFYIVHKPSSLFREDSDEFAMETIVFNALKEQASKPVKTDSFSMNDGSMEAIRKFLTSPGKTPLRRSQATHFLAFELVLKAYGSHCQRAGGKAVGAEWAYLMKSYIDGCIETGEKVSALSVSERIHLSFSYAKMLFKAHCGVTIQEYILNHKLGFTKKLMDGGHTPTQAGNYVGLTYGYYNKAFGKAFGMTPREYARKSQHKK